MRRLSERYLVPFGDWEKPLVSDSATVGTSGEKKDAKPKTKGK